MQQIATIGLDLAKQFFQVHAADAQGSPVLNRKLRRGDVLRFFERLPRCLVGIEALEALTIGRGKLLVLGTRYG